MRIPVPSPSAPSGPEDSNLSRVKPAKKVDDKPQTWWERIKDILKAIAGTPRTIALVWKAHPGLTVLFVLLNIFYGVFPLTQAWLTKLLLDTIVISSATKLSAIPFVQHLPFIPHVLMSMKIAALFSLLGLFLLSEIVSMIAGRVFKHVLVELGDHLNRTVNLMILKKANSFVDISMFENPKFYDLLQKSQREANHRPLYLLRETGAAARGLINLIAMMVVLATFQPILVAVVVAVSIPQLYVSIRNERELYKLQSWESPQMRTMWYYGTVLTNEYMAKEVRLFNLGDFFLGRYMQKLDAYRERRRELASGQWKAMTFLEALSTLVHVAGYGYTAIWAVLGFITLGSFTLYTQAMNSIHTHMANVIHSLTSVYENNMFVNNLFEFLDLPEPMRQAPPSMAKMVPLPLKQGIEFHNVSFSYEGSDKKVLDEICFELKPGQSVAVVGENGAGKTTLVKLLSRLYDPTGGEILVDGNNLRDYNLADWRQRTSVIFQDFAHYSVTVQENIGVGQVKFVDDYPMVKLAAKKGGAAEMVDKLNHGYDTTLGGWFGNTEREEVTELSGGEWQKIALSRAFMRSKLTDPDDLNGKNHWEDVLSTSFKEAQLLILDEPTSSLDAQAEHDVYQRFKELTAGKITLLISHRFSTVRMADVIIVMEKGKVIEQGNHDELMEKNGTYSRLYKLQAERYS